MIKKALIFFSLFIQMYCANAMPVVLVKGTSSLPVSERNYASSLTKRLERWLKSEGIPVIVTDDNHLAQYVAKTRVVILGYNANPGKTELNTLRSYVGKGGKIILFYGSSGELASLMGVKIGRYKSAPLQDKWNEIRFIPDSGLYGPKTVYQNSHNIRTVIPIVGKAKTVAYWADINGRNTGDPAIVKSIHGFWMTHVLLDDGDISAKKRMLLSLIADCDKSIWKPAAGHSFRQVQNKISGVLRGTKTSGWQKDFTYLKELMQRGKYPEAVTQAEIVLRMAMYSYAGAQKPVKGERHIIWDHTGTGLYPENWNKTCRILKKYGITDILVNVSWAGMSHYYSKVTARSDITQRWGDQLQAAVAAAHKEGIKLHAWKICWNLSRATPEFINEMKRTHRLQVSDTGKTKNWLCPSNRKNVELELNAIKEMSSNYKIDGIHLDYIRYPDSHYCYCEVCRKNFERYIGRKITRWPYDVKSGRLSGRYAQWRKSLINNFVRQAHEIVTKQKGKQELSAAVFGRYPLCAESVAQDWGKWLRNGTIDFVCPMNYTSDMRKFSGLVNSQVTLPNAKGRVYPGIGVTAAECHLDGFDVIQQIRIVRRSGAGGFTLFCLNRELEKETLPILRKGVLK